ncbi:MAG: glutamate--cysteine ligase [Amphritea sp.]
MGLEVNKTEFSSQEFERFRAKLFQNLDALKALLQQPDFGQGKSTVGAELELYIVDLQGRPLLINSQIQKRLGDPQLTLELNRYNLEYNLTPVAVTGRPFSQIENEITDVLQRLNQLAEEHDGLVIPIGILPTLQRSDFGLQAMTDLSRYHVLTKALAEMRGESFSVKIDGADPISLRSSDVTLEGANTSMQMHYRVAPDKFADTYNAIQLITPIVLAVSGNSPFLLGHRLWHETRIPLFKHSIDGRSHDSRESHLPARVSYGNGWVRHGAYELFAETVHLYPPILPICKRESARRQLAKGEIPALFELILHQGTVWPWNRPVYDSGDGGHLRIEMRALPAGPSACDMMANAAFAIGLAEGFRQQMEQLLPAIPFQAVVYNFYRAAEKGMQAELMWPKDLRENLTRTPAIEIARSLLPVAKQGLESIGIADAEIRHYLGMIECRLAKKKTGACWQLRQYNRLSRKLVKRRALRRMLEHYIENSLQNRPISEWMDIP